MLNVIVRIGVEGGYAGVAMSFSVSKIVNTAMCMMAAAFPIYNAFATGYVFELSDISKSSMVLSVAFALIFVIAFYVFKEKEANKRERVITYCMGASLWILPALLIGMSARYQNEVRWGTDWLPYFAEVIGTSIIIVQFCRDLYHAIAYSTCWKWMKHILSMCLFFFIGYAALWNRTAAEHSYSKTEMNAFYTIQNALELGILNDVTSNDVIHVWPTIGSENEPYMFYSRFAKKKCNADILVSEEQYSLTDYSAYENEYIAKKIQLGPDEHIFTVGLMNNGIVNKVSYPLVYIPGSAGNEMAIFLTESNNVEEYKEISASDMLKIFDEKGKIVQIPYENVTLDSIQISREAVTDGMMTPGYSFVKMMAEKYNANVVDEDIIKLAKGLSVSDMATYSILWEWFVSVEDGGMTDEEYVENLYMLILNRKSDGDGKVKWVNAIQSGVQREQVFRAFLGSEEFLMSIGL